jgi:hypothetical protein
MYVGSWCFFKFILGSIHDRSCKLKGTEIGSEKSVMVGVTDICHFSLLFLLIVMMTYIF